LKEILGGLIDVIVRKGKIKGRCSGLPEFVHQKNLRTKEVCRKTVQPGGAPKKKPENGSNLRVPDGVLGLMR